MSWLARTKRQKKTLGCGKHCTLFFLRRCFHKNLLAKIKQRGPNDRSYACAFNWSHQQRRFHLHNWLGGFRRSETAASKNFCGVGTAPQPFASGCSEVMETSFIVVSLKEPKLQLVFRFWQLHWGHTQHYNNRSLLNCLPEQSPEIGFGISHFCKSLVSKYFGVLACFPQWHLIFLANVIEFPFSEKSCFHFF